MNNKLIQTLTGAAFLLAVNAVQAAISCNISSPGFINGYDNTILNSNQTSYSVTCTRGVDATDPTTTTYAVQVNNGLNPAGNTNQGASGANLIKYDTFTNSMCNAAWKNNTTIPTPAGTITMVGLLSTTVTQNFWGCLNAGLLPTAGIYTDTVTMTPTYSAGVLGGAGTFPVKIITPATCTISAIPNITLAYGDAFRLTPATATTSAPVTCSNQLPYTIAVSPTSGVSAGINYSLSLPSSGTGTGAVQNIIITATAPAGQAGTCTTSSCTGAPQPHTLTVTY